MAKERSSYWDACKGLAILAVIYIHALGPADAYGVRTWNFQFGIVSQQCLDFAVGVFLAISGYLAGLAKVGTGSEIRAFYARRLSRLIPPYLAWTAVTMLALGPRDFLHPSAFAGDVLMGLGIHVGYFVMVLSQFILLTPLLARLRGDRAHFAVMAAVSLLARAIHYWLRLRHPDWALARFPANALPFPVWYPFYHLGFWLRRKEAGSPGLFAGKEGVFLAGYALFLGASMAEGELLAAHGYKGLGGSQIKITSMLATLCLFFAMFAAGKRDAPVPGVLAWLGRHSYPIYLSHILFLTLIQEVALPSRFLAAYIVASGLLVVGLCAACIAVGRRVFPWRHRDVWLGF